MKTYAIGDIHGCAEELHALLSLINPQPEDQLVFLGDYVDRGPDSRGVIETLIELNRTHNAVFLLGNHDVWMMRARHDRDWYSSWLSRGVGGIATLRSYASFKHVPDEHWEFFEKVCRNYYETDTQIFVHGAVEPDLPLNKQPEQVLLWERINDQQPHTSGKRIVCGHTAQKNGIPFNKGYAVCIDTCCHGGGYLTALCTETDDVFQVKHGGKSRTRNLADFDKV